MKKSLLVLAVAMLSVPAFADDGIVVADPTEQFESSGETRGVLTVNGKLKQTTCFIEQDSVNKTVTLPDVETQSLVGTNFAGRTAFTLSLTKCPSYYYDEAGEKKTSVGITFDRSSNISVETGNLKNTFTQPNAAKNVEVQLLDANEVAINLRDKDNIQKVSLSSNAKNHIFQYSAQYVAVAGAEAKAGEFSSNIPFKVVYK